MENNDKNTIVGVITHNNRVKVNNTTLEYTCSMKGDNRVYLNDIVEGTIYTFKNKVIDAPKKIFIIKKKTGKKCDPLMDSNT